MCGWNSILAYLWLTSPDLQYGRNLTLSPNSHFAISGTMNDGDTDTREQGWVFKKFVKGMFYLKILVYNDK